MQVGVVTVGDELLAGDVTNTNAAWLGARLTERGARVRRVVTLPDDVGEIADHVAAYAAEFDAVVVTGGLGPTHDDRTMEGVAVAFDRALTEHPDAVAWLEAHGDYAYADLAEGTADLPAGARLLENPEGVAPGAVVENVYVLPGVPAEMEAMFESVVGEFTGERRHVEFLYADEPESALIDRIAAVRERFGVDVGSYPGDGVRLKLQHADPEVLERASAWLAERIEEGGRERAPDDGDR